MRRISLALVALVLVIGVASAPPIIQSKTTSGGDFVHFESGQVHPIAMTPDSSKVLVVNTPDNRLSIFSLADTIPHLIAEVPVGLEPVTVSVLDNNTAWVVNNLSDDVSIVDLTLNHTVSTLRVGDEPSDVVFAGSPRRAYVSVSQEDRVKVYDPTSHAQVASIAINGHMPRAMAVSPSGLRVFVQVFQAGNETSVISAADVNGGVDLLNDPDFPRNLGNKSGHPDFPSGPADPPAVGHIIQWQPPNNTNSWFDNYAVNWSSKAPYTMYKTNVSDISTATNTVVKEIWGPTMGSINYSIAVSPKGRIVTTATDARNLHMYEPGVQSYMVETRINFVSPSGNTVLPRLLNPHVDYNPTNFLGTPTERDSAFGIPVAVAFGSDSSRCYVASFSNDKIAVILPNSPVAGGSTSSTDQIKGRIPTVHGPSGLLVDDAHHKLYVVGRFLNELQTLSTGDFHQMGLTRIGFDPTPDEIVNGRRTFYSGLTSGHGEHACATCHVFGDKDGLVWNLGNPLAAFVPPPITNPLGLEGFDPQKGPMVTQSLRGMTSTEPLHWRGDRADITAFNGAFVSLMGHGAPLPDSLMTAFADFVMPLVYPPNPRTYLNDSLPDAPPGVPSAKRGHVFYMNENVDGQRCVDCHSAGTGTNDQMVPDQTIIESQDLKVPQLRNLYTKQGFSRTPGAVNKRGSGFTHDGSVGTLFDFLHAPQFNFGPPVDADNNRRDVEAFLLSFDTGMSHAVGYQVTFNTPSPDAEEVSRVDTLMTVADGGRCQVIARGLLAGYPHNWLYQGANEWKPDSAAGPNVTTSELIALGSDPSTAVTFTGVPPGTGTRMALDRDRDTYFDLDELHAGSNPGNFESTPANVGVGDPGPQTRVGIEMIKPNPSRAEAEIVFSLAQASAVDIGVYDVLGREVRSLARGQMFAAGRRSVVWDGVRSDGSHAGAGMYFVRVKAAVGGSWTRGLVRIR